MVHWDRLFIFPLPNLKVLCIWINRCGLGVWEGLGREWGEVLVVGGSLGYGLQMSYKFDLHSAPPAGSQVPPLTLPQPWNNERQNLLLKPQTPNPPASLCLLSNTAAFSSHSVCQGTNTHVHTDTHTQTHTHTHTHSNPHMEQCTVSVILRWRASREKRWCHPAGVTPHS